MKFINKQLSIKFKEKGFDKPCFGYYFIEDKYENNLHKNITCGGDVKNCLRKLSDEKRIDAPTIEQVLEWLREDKDIHIKSDICFRYTSEHKKDKNGTYSGYMDVSKPFWSFLIRKIKNGNCVYDNTTASNNEYFSYEDACIAGIEYVINNLI